MANASMSRYLIGFLLAALCSVGAQNRSYFSGTISQDTRWSGEIYVDGDVIVARGVTLTIDSGSRIIFKARTDRMRSGEDPELAEIIVYGKLIARGRERGGRIIFTSESSNPQMKDWYGIVFKNLREPSILEYCLVEYGYKGITCYGSSPRIDNCEVRFNYYIGISVEVRAKPIIRNTLVLGNGFAGINCELAAAPLIERSVINQNTNGIIIFDRSQPDLGVYPEEEGKSIGENRIFNNFEYDVYNHSSNDIYAQNNIWNTENPEELDEHIYDRSDHPAYGEVIYTPIYGTRVRFARRRPAAPPLPSPLLESQPVGTDTLLARTEATTGETGTVEESPPPESRTPAETENQPAETAETTPTAATPAETLNIARAETPPEENPESPATEPEAETETPPPAPAIVEPVLEALLDGGKREYIRRVKPEFPEIYKRTRREGLVIMEVIVARDGSVESYRILRSDGEAFSEAVKEAIRQFRYKPGTINGKPVRFRVIERFRFKLLR
ncbi:MAG: TonB family protein [Calditrichaeota bacterium]|nr:TonB family protein [Calditrichota bacterium]